MIAIVNTSTKDNADQGEASYEVRINRLVVTEFSHVRSDGLAICLKKAADAVEKASKQRDLEFLELLGLR